MKQKQYYLKDMEGHEFKGTAIEVVMQMQERAFFDRELPLPAYLRKLTQNVWRFYGLGVDIGNGTLEEQCARFLEAITGKLLFPVKNQPADG
jgi:hypothetical protein